MELTPISETSGEKKKKKRSEPRESIIKVADKAIEKEAARPRGIYYGLEDTKEKPPIPPPAEILKSSKAEKDNYDDDEEEDEELAVEAEPVSEAEAPSEAISPETEQPAIVKKLARFEKKALGQPEAVADKAVEVLYSEVEESGDIEAGAQAAREALGITEHDIQAQVAPEAAPAESPLVEA